MSNNGNIAECFRPRSARDRTGKRKFREKSRAAGDEKLPQLPKSPRGALNAYVRPGTAGFGAELVCKPWRSVKVVSAGGTDGTGGDGRGAHRRGVSASTENAPERWALPPAGPEPTPHSRAAHPTPDSARSSSGIHHPLAMENGIAILTSI